MERIVRFEIGPIEWNGKFNAVVISDLTREDVEQTPFAAIFAWQILARNPEVSEPPAKWAMFAKPHPTRQDWRLLGVSSGRRPLQEEGPWSDKIPEQVVQQLEKLSP
jgi:hypothetical protein